MYRCVHRRLIGGTAARVDRARSSSVAHETVERLKQRIHDCLTQRLSRLADLSFVSAAGSGGQIRTLICQDRIGPIDRPLCEIVPAVDDSLFHDGALPRLRFLWPIPATIRVRDRYCVRANTFVASRDLLNKPFRFTPVEKILDP